MGQSPVPGFPSRDQLLLPVTRKDRPPNFSAPKARTRTAGSGGSHAPRPANQGKKVLAAFTAKATCRHTCFAPPSTAARQRAASIRRRNTFGRGQPPFPADVHFPSNKFPAIHWCPEDGYSRFPLLNSTHNCSHFSPPIFAPSPLPQFHFWISTFPSSISILCSAAAPALAQLFHLLLHATFAEMTTGTITTAKSAMPSSTPTLAIKRTAKSQRPPTKSCSSSSAMQPRRRPTKFAASSIIALASLLAVTLLLLTGTPEGAEARILPEPMTANGLEQSGGWRTWHQQQPQSSHEESAEADAEEAESLPQRGKEKRRLVVRVPFAQNPDGLQLSRIYKSLFEPSNSRAKKQPWTYSLRHFVQQQGNDEAN